MGMSVEEIKAINAAMGSEEEEEQMAQKYRAAFKVKCYIFWQQSYTCVSQEFDEDNSGTISPEELHQMMKKLGEEMDEAEVSFQQHMPFTGYQILNCVCLFNTVVGRCHQRS